MVFFLGRSDGGTVVSCEREKVHKNGRKIVCELFEITLILSSTVCAILTSWGGVKEVSMPVDGTLSSHTLCHTPERVERQRNENY